jgi:NAD(P)-dependent dehydrogenase (short-subunit alcohol dehydrogenase family)
VALELFPKTAAFPKPIRMSQYSGMISVIKGYLHDLGMSSNRGAIPKGITQLPTCSPSPHDIETTLNVLDMVLKSTRGNITLQSPLEDVVSFLRSHAQTLSQEASPQQSHLNRATLVVRNSLQKKCYICQYVLLAPHPQYSSLCHACGEYNLASSALSLPSCLNLDDKAALVTGGRVNLGYHTALRLLRCGAHVIVSTRYPYDAEKRYLAELDADNWKQRLRLIGADFRTASDVFHLVSVVKECLKEWSSTKRPKLDILINNAAQTLTDSVQKEGAAVKKEELLLLENRKHATLLIGTYIRGGISAPQLGLSRTNPKMPIEDVEKMNFNDEVSDISSASEAVSRTVPPSSWLQSIQQIPYEDIISAHSVNTFVPLILIREFLPIMRSDEDKSAKGSAPRKPASYIINVSSREGIFEATTKSAAKHGKHVHTNLTKAALNMLTETEAGSAWRNGRIAVNTVDPGFMSAAPEIEKKWKEKEGDDWTCPIGWEDGAGRVLWPIAINEQGKGPIWGRFLKHFGAVEIDVSVGR